MSRTFFDFLIFSNSRDLHPRGKKCYPPTMILFEFLLQPYK